MRIPRVYIDTSVIGGCFDDEFSYWSKILVSNFKFKHFKPVLSDIVANEINHAPTHVIKKYAEIISYGAELLISNSQSAELVKHYRSHKILSDKFTDDMMHIALATIAEVDILVSWNFKHIVHYDKIYQFNAINIKKGYKPLAIYSPREVAYEEKI